MRNRPDGRKLYVVVTETQQAVRWLNDGEIEQIRLQFHGVVSITPFDEWIGKEKAFDYDVLAQEIHEYAKANR